MSVSYRFDVKIEGIGDGKSEEVLSAIGDEFESTEENWPPGDKEIRVTGYVYLSGSARTEDFAREISRVVWEANEGYCPVRVNVTRLDVEPDAVFDFDEADHDYLDDGAEHSAILEDGAPDCPDCGTIARKRHHQDCDVERCPVCCGKKIGCHCDGHDPVSSAWDGEYPPISGEFPGCVGEPPENIRAVCPEKFSPDAALAVRPPESFVDRFVKKSFPTGEPTPPFEHMWVFVRETSGGKLLGTLANEPAFCRELGLGDTIEVAMDEIDSVSPEIE
jgi:hypothetical protein